MNLQDIDVRAQPLDARLDGVKDVLARQANAIDELAVVVRGGGDGRLDARVVGHAEIAFAEDD